MMRTSDQAPGEMLDLSNWLLRRDDQQGCVVYAHIDDLEGLAGR
jgi:hypothetical protein